MLHENSIGQDFHPAFLERLFRKLYKVCLLLFLFWYGYEFIQIETLSYLLYIRKTVISESPFMLKVRLIKSCIVPTP